MAVGAHYNKTRAFSYLSKVSDEKKIQTQEILKVTKFLKNNTSFLDIGAGAGDIFFDVAKNFDESAAVEPGKRMLEILREKAKRKKKNIEIFAKGWNEFYKKYQKKFKNHFDLIICMHTIYFFDDNVKEIKRMLELLNENGRLVIIQGYVSNPKRDFISKFRHDFTGTSFFNNERYGLVKRHFKKNRKTKFINTIFVLQNFKDLEKDHLSKKSAPTNYFLKFAIKKWFDELMPEQKIKLLDYLEPLKKGNKYIIKNKQIVHVFRKN